MSKTATLIRFDGDTLARLDALKDSTGHSIASIVRKCVEQHLPKIDAKVKGETCHICPSVPAQPVVRTYH